MSCGIFGGTTFALSTHGLASRREVEAAISANSGAVSRIVHRRVDFLVATDAAVRNNTQAVRKATKHSVPLVRPDFVLDSIRAGALLSDCEAYAPTAAAAAVAEEAAPRGFDSPALSAVGLAGGDVIEVCVEMSDEPREQWWPARIEQGCATSGAARRGLHALMYLPLPSRGYEDESASRARFEREGPAGGTRRLWDAEEAVWRLWRRPGGRVALPAAAPAPAAAQAADECGHGGRGARRSRGISWVARLLVRRGASRTRAAIAISRAGRRPGRHPGRGRKPWTVAAAKAVAVTVHAGRDRKPWAAAAAEAVARCCQ